jgi:hypothetical protein
MKRLYPYLTYAGVLPFVLCAFCTVFDIHVIPLLGSTDHVICVYALVITSFMAGTHWGQHLNLEDKWSLYLPIFSNINAVLLWIGFLILPVKLLLAVFIISFLGLLLIEKSLLQDALISVEYFLTRCVVTGIVILTLAISAIYT